MPEPIHSYWDLVKPVFDKISVDTPASFFASIALVPRPVLLLYAAQFCLAEIYKRRLPSILLELHGINRSGIRGWFQ